MVISGVVASLLYGYHVAAVVRDWTLTHDAAGWRLAGRLSQAHPHRIRQQPLIFQAPHARGVWRWPVLSLEGTETVTAHLGPKEGSSP